METAINWNLFQVKNCLILPKTKLDLDILMINMYLYFSMCNLVEENAQKLQITGFFLALNPRGIYSVKNCLIIPESATTELV